MIHEKRLDVGTSTILYDGNLDSIRITAWPYLFDANYIQQYGYVTHIAQGRGDTYFYDFEEHKLVLKHYWRGGLIGKFNKDLYLKTGVENTRAFKEWKLLVKLCEWGLPVPKPAGVRVLSGGLFYYADLVTHQLERVTPLSDCLLERDLDESTWRKVGATVKLFHDKNVYHDDLNAHNILLSEDEMFVIDFDKGDIRKPGKWKEQNLSRLKRSLLKQRGIAEEEGRSYYFTESQWQSLLAGYQG